MTDPTTVADVPVNGQRRKANGAFPSIGSGGAHNPTGPSSTPRTEPMEPTESTDQDTSCSDPASKRIWNADAAAAAAAREMMAKATSLGATLGNREFGTTFSRGPNGSVTSPPVVAGPPAVNGQIPGVELPPTPMSLYMGDIHSHPSGQGALSGGEWNVFINYVSQISASYPDRRPELSGLAAYVVVLDATAPAGYRIYASTRDTPPDVLGKEVNPDAVPCP